MRKLYLLLISAITLPFFVQGQIDIEYNTPCVLNTIPTGNSVSFCLDSSAILAATPGAMQNYVVWVDSTGRIIGEGSPFITEPLQATTSFSARDAHIIGSHQTVGPLNNISANGFLNTALGLYVTVERPLYIDSMLVKSDGALTMAVNVWNHDRTHLIRRSDSINITGAGDHRIFVGMTIAPGNYFFNVQFLGGSGQLFRAVDGASFPYAIQDLISIDSIFFVHQFRYYYLFEWVVREVCLGDTTVNVNANLIPAQAIATADIINISGSNFVWQFDGSGSLGATSYHWSFGDGSTGTGPTPVHTYTASGMYTVELTIQTQCGPRNILFWVTCGIFSSAEDGLTQMIVYPNPTRDQLAITFESGKPQTVRLELVNSLGQQIWAETVQNHSGTYRKELSLGTYAKGIYHLRIHTATGTHTERISLQ